MNIREKLNQSEIGQFVNNTAPGKFVETYCKESERASAEMGKVFDTIDNNVKRDFEKKDLIPFYGFLRNPGNKSAEYRFFVLGAYQTVAMGITACTAGLLVEYLTKLVK